MLKGKTVVLGVTGGIAVYKSVDLVSRLRKENANVEVIMTEGAKEFIRPLTFQTMSNNVVHHKMFSEITSYDVEHISLAKKADILVVAPATANIIGKVAAGISDDLLSTVIMATKAQVVFAPAMNTAMYENPIVQENISRLKDLGYKFISPEAGLLACGDIGSGKMAEPVQILEYIASNFVEKDLEGVDITISAGPTLEPLDPVRYLSNRSSGKMGYSLAKNALDRGARVNLITGPTRLEPPTGANVVNVTTTREMLDALDQYFENTNVLIKSAAPSDYRPAQIEEQKIKKNSSTEELNLKLVENPDIAAYLGSKKQAQVMVGFAAETNNLISNASKKVKKKNLDFIVANDVTLADAGFDGDRNTVSIIDKNGEVRDYPNMAKSQVAEIILDKVKDILKERS